MSRIASIEYRDENFESRYPFEDGCSLRTTSKLTLPNSLLLDAAVHPIGDYSAFRLTAIETSPTLVTFTIGDERYPAIASGSYNPQAPEESIPLLDEFGRTCGLFVLAVDVASVLAAWPKASHTFDKSAATFVASCCHPQPTIGVLGIQMPDGRLVTGDVWLVGEHGVQLAASLGSGVESMYHGYYQPSFGDDAFFSASVVVLNAVGDPLFRRVECTGGAAESIDLFQPPRFVKTINSVRPTADGVWMFVPKDPDGQKSAIRIQPESEKELSISFFGKKMGS